MEKTQSGIHSGGQLERGPTGQAIQAHAATATVCLAQPHNYCSTHTRAPPPLPLHTHARAAEPVRQPHPPEKSTWHALLVPPVSCRQLAGWQRAWRSSEVCALRAACLWCGGVARWPGVVGVCCEARRWRQRGWIIRRAWLFEHWGHSASYRATCVMRSGLCSALHGTLCAA